MRGVDRSGVAVDVDKSQTKIPARRLSAVEAKRIAAELVGFLGDRGLSTRQIAAVGDRFPAGKSAVAEVLRERRES